MEFSEIFEPIDPDKVSYPDLERKRFGDKVIKYTTGTSFPDVENMDMAIIGVLEDRKAFHNQGCAMAPDEIRQYLYKLFPPNQNLKIVDLGNIPAGYELDDTYFALSTVLAELLEMNIVPIVLGGSQDLSYANYLAYENLGRIINIVSIDSEFDLGETHTEFNSRSYITKIILHQPNFLFNYTNIGYQGYFVDQEAVHLMKNLLFDSYRLGELTKDLNEVEPLVRNADMLSVDISAVRQSDAPGNKNATPNGFYGEQLCQMMRFAGMSDKLSSIGFYEINPACDVNGQTTHLVAQAIWHFIEGFYNRQKDFPFRDKNNYLKYIVNTDELSEDVIFFKSKRTDRWWMEVNCPTNLRHKYERHYLVPCSYKDYLTACENDIPDRWWQVYQKLM